MSDKSPTGTDDDTPATKPNPTRGSRLKIKACDLEIEAESQTESVEEMMQYCSEEMESLMEYHLVGDMVTIEEKDLFSEIFGGNR